MKANEKAKKRAIQEREKSTNRKTKNLKPNHEKSCKKKKEDK